MTLGTRLQRGRAKAGLTLEALAAQFAVAVRTLIRWEQDECTPDAESLVKVLAFLQQFEPELTLAQLLRAPEPVGARSGKGR